MRAFVALEIAEPDVLDALVAEQSWLSGTEADLKLVERENLHFTVRFLGEITDRAAAEADSRLRQLSLNGCEADVRGLGAFPSIARPRVIWAGVSPQNEGLVASVAFQVARALDGIGKPEDSPFRAHITLARVRSSRNAQSLASEIRSKESVSFGRTRLAALKLKSSVLTPRGPVYADIGVYTLT